MLYKRPNFKMGGSPTGIETLEPRKKFKFGTSGFSFLEPGLQRELQIQNELRNKPTQPTRFNQLFKRFPRILPLGIYGTAATTGAGIGQLFDFYAKSTKTPEEYKRLKQMSGANFNFDETNPDVGEILEYIDKGGEIGEAPGFFPRGGKKKFFKDLLTASLKHYQEIVGRKQIAHITDDQAKIYLEKSKSYFPKAEEKGLKQRIEKSKKLLELLEGKPIEKMLHTKNPNTLREIYFEKGSWKND